MSRARGCVECPELSDGTPSGYEEMKEGGTRLRACCPPGMWANQDIGHDTCFDCASAKSCIGNGECDTGFEGNWCAACKSGWFQANQACCKKTRNLLYAFCSAKRQSYESQFYALVSFITD